jgi:heme exporter protein B
MERLINFFKTSYHFLSRSSPIWTLFKKDVLLEIRQQYAFYGVVLYVGATIFVLYMAIEEPESRVWNGLFWVLQLFICINAVAKSFLQESSNRLLYYHSIASPQQFIVSKLLFNAVLMLAMSTAGFLLFTLFLGNPGFRFWNFLALVLTGGVSLSLVFTFLAAIAAKAQQNAAIMAILGFPIIIPQLILLMKLSATAFSTQGSLMLTPLLLLASMDGLVVLVAIILFPFLWKD